MSGLSQNQLKDLWVELGAVDKAFGEKSWPGREGGYQEEAEGWCCSGEYGERRRGQKSGSETPPGECSLHPNPVRSEMRIKQLKSGYLRIKIFAFEMFLALKMCKQSTEKEAGAPWGV